MIVRPPEPNPDCMIVHLVVEGQFYDGTYTEGGQGRRECRKTQETEEATVDVQLGVRCGSDMIGGEEG